MAVFPSSGCINAPSLGGTPTHMSIPHHNPLRIDLHCQPDGMSPVASAWAHVTRADLARPTSTAGPARSAARWAPAAPHHDHAGQRAEAARKAVWFADN